MRANPQEGVGRFCNASAAPRRRGQRAPRHFAWNARVRTVARESVQGGIGHALPAPAFER
jgi:hypothetical protein